jgi:hypothetical protein
LPTAWTNYSAERGKVVSRGGRKLQSVPPAALQADEQALLVAYRTMDDRARGSTLRIAIRSAEQWPAPAERGPRLMAMPLAALPLLRNFCSMSASSQNDVCCMVAAIAEDEAARLERQPLCLVIGDRP